MSWLTATAIQQAFDDPKVRALPDHVQRAYRALLSAKRDSLFAEYAYQDAVKAIRKALRFQTVAEDTVIQALHRAGLVVVDCNDVLWFLTPSQAEGGEVFAEV